MSLIERAGRAARSKSHDLPAQLHAGMAASSSPEASSLPVVVHGVGSVTDSVLRVLEPVVATLAAAGCRQIIVSTGSSRDALAPLGSALVQVITVGDTAADGPGAWWAWVRRLRAVQLNEACVAVHLHGFVPYVLGRFGLSSRRPVRLLYTPHGSKAHTGNGPIHRLVRAVASVLRPSAGERTLVGSEVDAFLLLQRSRNGVHRTKVAVDPAYFQQVKTPAARALVMGGVLDDPAQTAAEFGRLAVLLGDTTQSGADFEWLGAADERTSTLLTAAQVKISPDKAALGRAERLATGWLFVCPSPTHGVPGHLIEAAACGLPVVAIESPLHRELVRDGETGFVCQSLSQMVDRVGQLLEDDRLRAAMGEQAVRWARTAVSGDQSASELVGLYGLSDSAP